MSFSRLTGRLSSFLWSVKDRNRNPYNATAQQELAFDRKNLDALVFERLKRILYDAYHTSKHYKSLFEEWGVMPDDLKSFEEIKRFPCLTRAHLQGRLEEITVQGTDRSSWTRSATGGTTSSPVSYYRDQHSTWRRWADTTVFDTWYGRHIGDRVAYLWGAAQDFSVKPSFGMRLRNIMYQRSIMLPSAPLDDKVFENYLQRLDQWKPIFLQAYPSALYEFCCYLKEKNRSIPYLRGVSVTAEPLYTQHREVIESVLGLKVFNWYGSRELGRVASECECHNGLHINEPSVYVEVEKDRTLPDGCGHLIITDLWNNATPFIRYRTGDIAKVVEGECSCGRALKRIASIEGRITDMILLPGGRKIAGVSLTNRVIKDFSEINELQIIQKEQTKFHIRYVKGPKFKPTSLELLKENFCELVASEVAISFEEVFELPREQSGKIRFVKCEIEDSGGSIPTSSGVQREEFHV